MDAIRVRVPWVIMGWGRTKLLKILYTTMKNHVMEIIGNGINTIGSTMKFIEVKIKIIEHEIKIIENTVIIGSTMIIT